MNTGIRAEINERTKVTYDDPRQVARRIFKAIERREKEVRIGFPERLFAFINAIAPSVIDRGLEKNRKIGESLLNETATSKEHTNEKISLSSVRSSH
jgi:hypothetical protein